MIENNLTRLDCQRKGFSGVRLDKIIENYELWLMGRLVREVPVSAGKKALATAYEEEFGLAKDTVDFGD